MIKIKALPKAFNEGRFKSGFAHSETYITNGSFMVPKAYVKEFYKYCGPTESEKLEDSQLERIIPSEEDARFVYRATNRLFDYGDFYVREFICSDHFAEEAKKAYIREDYVKHFEITQLQGTNHTNPLIIPGYKIVIMPCRDPKSE